MYPICDKILLFETSANVSEAHLHLAKLWGITLLAGAVLSFASLCYRDDEDAVGTLKAKLIVSTYPHFVYLLNSQDNSILLSELPCIKQECESV